jgi:hypothetical protein
MAKRMNAKPDEVFVASAPADFRSGGAARWMVVAEDSGDVTQVTLDRATGLAKLETWRVRVARH